MLKQIILVGVGGGAGSIFRFLTSVLVNKYYSLVFPLATFIINIAGCLLIGLLYGLAERYSIGGSEFKSLLIVGFCGGYTTFSTFSAENMKLLEGGHYVACISYVLASVLVGLGAVWLGNVWAKA